VYVCFDEEEDPLGAWEVRRRLPRTLSLPLGVVQTDTIYKADATVVCQTQLNIMLFSPFVLHEVILDNVTPLIFITLDKFLNSHLLPSE
jgi:hypothetical protein